MNVLLSDSGLQIGTHVPFEKNLTKVVTHPVMVAIHNPL